LEEAWMQKIDYEDADSKNRSMKIDFPETAIEPWHHVGTIRGEVSVPTRVTLFSTCIQCTNVVQNVS
jgi:hypothetical protein